jgi:hypothetical protein
MMSDATSLLAALEKMRATLGPVPVLKAPYDFTSLRKHVGTFGGIDVVTSPIVPKGEIWFETDAGRVGRITNLGESDE